MWIDHEESAYCIKSGSLIIKRNPLIAIDKINRSYIFYTCNTSGGSVIRNKQIIDHTESMSVIDLVESSNKSAYCNRCAELVIRNNA